MGQICGNCQRFDWACPNTKRWPFWAATSLANQIPGEVDPPVIVIYQKLQHDFGWSMQQNSIIYTYTHYILDIDIK